MSYVYFIGLTRVSRFKPISNVEEKVGETAGSAPAPPARENTKRLAATRLPVDAARPTGSAARRANPVDDCRLSKASAISPSATMAREATSSRRSCCGVCLCSNNAAPSPTVAQPRTSGVCGHDRRKSRARPPPQAPACCQPCAKLAPAACHACAARWSQPCAPASPPRPPNGRPGAPRPVSSPAARHGRRTVIR